MLALHFEQAGENARAAKYLVMAGDHALERFANREAIGFFSRASGLADESQGELRLRAAVGGAKASWGFKTSGREVDELELAVASGENAEPKLVCTFGDVVGLR